MKRLLTAATVALAVLVTATAGSGAGGDDGDRRVDAVFDNASGLIPGQDVKVAGAKVGSVQQITLTAERRARVEMEVDAPFVPFRRDAECSIRPQSLIGEKFIQCDPGTPDAPELASAGDETPTVPVEQTHAPIDLDLVFAALRLPYRERLAVVVNELGAGLAGRGGDLNDVIRRANPAIHDARRLLATLDRQRDALGKAIDGTDQVIGSLANRRDRVAGFVTQAARVTSRTAGKRGEVEETVRRLPALLERAEPALDELAGLTKEGTPVVRDLRRSAPGLRRLLATFDPLAESARPSIARLGKAAATGRRAVREAGPTVAGLRDVSERLRPIVEAAHPLTESAVASGVPESLLRFTYYATVATSRFDSISHIFPAHFLAGECSAYSTEPNPDCSARFGLEAAGAPSGQGNRGDRRQGGPGERGAPGGGAEPPGSQQPPSRPERDGPAIQLPELPRAPALPQLPELPQLPDPPALRGLDHRSHLLDFLLRS